jgi:hypothetical protein
MSTQYAGVPTFPVSAALPDDGVDDRSASSVNVPFEALFDRTQYLNQQSLVRADLAALAAITAPIDGTVRHVAGQGLYVFKSSATTGLSPFRVAAADGTPGGWLASHAHETARTRYVPGARIRGVTSAAQPPPAVGEAFQFNPLTALDGYFYAGGTFVVARSSTHATNAWGFWMPIDEFLVHGATLASATLKWCPDTTTAPTVMPQIHVVRSIRVGIGGPGDTLLGTLRSGGYAIDSGGTYAPTVTRDLTYTTDQNNTIDLATYNYAVIIFDEHGTNATTGNAFHSVALAMTNILDGRR